MSTWNCWVMVGRARRVRWSAVVLLVSALSAVAEPGKPVVAVLPFAPDSKSNDPEGPRQFVELVEAKLLAEDVAQWVDRKRMDAAITELAGQLGQNKQPGSLQIGQWTKADILITGRFVSGELTRSLEVAAINVGTAEELASKTFKLKGLAFAPLQIRDEEVAEVADFLATTVRKGTESLGKDTGKIKVAPLFIQNVTMGRGSLDAYEDEVLTALSEAASQTKTTRIVRFKGAGASSQEALLALSGLVDADPDYRKKAADSFIWGEFEEHDWGGKKPEDVPVSLSLTLWNTARTPVTFSGSTNAGARQALARGLSQRVLTEVRKEPGATLSDAAATDIGQRLLKRVEDLRRPLLDSIKAEKRPGEYNSGTREEHFRAWTTSIRMLDVAYFIDPNSEPVHRELICDKWNSPFLNLLWAWVEEPGRIPPRPGDPTKDWRFHIDRYGMVFPCPPLFLGHYYCKSSTQIVFSVHMSEMELSDVARKTDAARRATGFTERNTLPWHFFPIAIAQVSRDAALDPTVAEEFLRVLVQQTSKHPGESEAIRADVMAFFSRVKRAEEGERLLAENRPKPAPVYVGTVSPDPCEPLDVFPPLIAPAIDVITNMDVRLATRVGGKLWFFSEADWLWSCDLAKPSPSVQKTAFRCPSSPVCMAAGKDRLWIGLTDSTVIEMAVPSLAVTRHESKGGHGVQRITVMTATDGSLYVAGTDGTWPVLACRSLDEKIWRHADLQAANKEALTAAPIRSISGMVARGSTLFLGGSETWCVGRDLTGCRCLSKDAFRFAPCTTTDRTWRKNTPVEPPQTLQAMHAGPDGVWCAVWAGLALYDSPSKKTMTWVPPPGMMADNTLRWLRPVRDYCRRISREGGKPVSIMDPTTRLHGVITGLDSSGDLLWISTAPNTIGHWSPNRRATTPAFVYVMHTPSRKWVGRIPFAGRVVAADERGALLLSNGEQPGPPAFPASSLCRLQVDAVLRSAPQKQWLSDEISPAEKAAALAKLPARSQAIHAFFREDYRQVVSLFDTGDITNIPPDALLFLTYAADEDGLRDAAAAQKYLAELRRRLATGQISEKEVDHASRRVGKAK